MNIGIDIDGVLTDITRYILDYGSKYFYEKYKKIDIKVAWSLEDMYNVSKEDDKECWLALVHDYATKEKARPFAKEIIKKLKSEGNKIYIITARCSEKWSNPNNDMEDIVKLWLKKNDIVYDKLILKSADKLKTCLENNIDIMIDDKKENINAIAKSLPVICFHAEHNISCKGRNIYRAYSWYDVYDKYLLIKKSNKH